MSVAEKLSCNVSKSNGEAFDKISKALEPTNEKMVNWSVTLVTPPKLFLDKLSNKIFSN